MTRSSRKAPAQTPEVRKTSRMQEAYCEILRRIVSLELAPGTTFTEGALAEQLGHSKTPVREALLLIGADGLVYPQIGSGYRVSQVTLKGARDLLRHWALLSAHAAAQAAEIGITSHELSMFSDIAESNLNVSGLALPADGETGFHLVLAMAARNEELLADVRRLHLKLQRLLSLAGREGNLLPDSHEDHSQILGAVQRGDVAAARQLVQDHAAAVEKAVMEALMTSDSLQVVNLG